MAESAPDMLAGLVIGLGNGVSLALGRDALIINGASEMLLSSLSPLAQKKAEPLNPADKELAERNRSRTCGIPIGSSSAETTLPYYNILWASVENELLIDSATGTSKTQLRCERLHYSLGDVSLATAQAWVATLLECAYGQAQRQRRAKVFVNPHSGPGGAVRIWEREVKPLFGAARMSVDVVRTSRRGEATEICESLDIDAYDVVVVCSGDGLAYEVFNGFAQRADARTALQKVAVAHIPCGSGNAMSCNLNGSHHPGPSALAVVKGIRTPVDLMSVTQDSRRILSFLSQSVGLIAECDLGTEELRWLGPSRFTVGILQRIFSKKVYPCDIAYKVVIDDKAQIKSHYKRMRNGEESSPKNGGDEVTTETSLSTGDFESDTGEGLPPLRYGTVNDKIPDDWQQISYDKLGSFYCGNMAWMAPDANFFPAACINDGLMDIVMNDGDLSFFKYLNLITSVGTERFYNDPLLSYQKMVAYRFTPRNQADGYISIDGERIPFEPFQVEVHSGLGTVLSKSGRYEAAGPADWEQAA
ncbi:sphingoid long chain base kinase-like protein [Xylaria nigripes]|nr:sphingoid long chain base kinase-like protein [Xylaria nigripes]